MTRQLWLEFPNAFYHVTLRGDLGEKIFEDDDDRSSLLEILAGVMANDNWLCHGYCLMDNHYHHIIETLDGNLLGGMRQFNGLYTHGSNRRYVLSDNLFQRRYKAILIDKDRYMLELSRYVVLNPLRAKVWSNDLKTGRGVAIWQWWEMLQNLNG